MRVKWLLKPAFSLIALVILGLGVGAIQFIPLFELAGYNFREGSASFQQVQSYAYPPRHALAFLMPNFYGSPAEHDYFDLFTGQQTPINWKRADGATVTDTYWEVNKNYVEGACYVGLLTLALAAIALINARFEKAPHAQIKTLAPYRGIFALLAVIAVSFIFGTVAYAILYYGLPGINQLHSPFRWVFPLTLCLAALAGFGAEALQRARVGLTPRPPLYGVERGGQTNAESPVGAGFKPAPATTPSFTFRLARIMGWALVWIGGAVLAALIGSRIFFAQLHGPIDSLFNKLAGANAAFPNVEAFYSYEFRQILFFALFLIACGVVIRVSRCPIYVRAPRFLLPNSPHPNPSPLHGEGLPDSATPPLYEVERGAGGEANKGLKPLVPVWEILALVVLALDLVVASVGFNPAADPAWLHFEPPAITWLKQHNPQDWRFTAVDGQTKTMNANLGWLYWLQDIRGYDSMIPKQYAEFMQQIQPQNQLLYNRIAALYPEMLNGKQWPSALNALSVKYVISDVPLDTSQSGSVREWKHGSSWFYRSTEVYKSVYQDQAVIIYENTSSEFFSPRAFMFPPVGFGDENSSEYRLTCNDSLRGSDGHFNRRPAQIVIAKHNEVIAETPDNQGGCLVLTDSYFPGWRAYIRPLGAPEDKEQEVPVLKVFGNFRAVSLPYGEQWTVRFRYSPPSFQIGAFTTFIALVILLFATLMWLWRRFYTEDASESGNARRFAKNSLAPIVLNLFNRGIDFAFAAIMLRILGPADAGTYYYAVVIFGWFDTITNFGLNLLLTREVARDRSQAWRYLFNTSVLRLALAGIGVPLLVAFLAIQQAIKPVEALAISAIVVLYIGLIPSSLSNGLTALFYAFEKAEIPNAITTVSAILKATLGLAVLLAGWGVIGLAGASIVINVITLAILAWQARGLTSPPIPHSASSEGETAPSPAGRGETSPHPQPLSQRRGESRQPVPPLYEVERGSGGEAKIDRALIRQMVYASWPLMLINVLSGIFYKIDVTLLQPLQGSKVVGQYSTAYKWLDALGIIPSLFTMALLPILSRQAHEDRAGLQRNYHFAVKLLVLLALPVAVATTFLAPTLIGLLGGANYLPDGAIALQLMVWFIPIGWINSLTNYVLIALDLQWPLRWAFVIGVGFNIIANVIFIPLFSYRAAAIITVLSEVVLQIAFYRLLRRELAPVPWIALLWKPVVAALTMFAALFVLWTVPVIALIVGGAAYLGVLIVLRPFNGQELGRLASLLPAPIRRLARIGSPA